MSFSADYLAQTRVIADALDPAVIEAAAEALASVRDRQGRLFIVGAGGGAGHAGHAVNDFRKLCDFEAYAPTDNVSELTARINDESWDSAYASWLKGSRFSKRDGLLVFSVGGGSEDPPVSMSIVNAVGLARSERGTIVGIVGPRGGVTAREADVCIRIPASEHPTPHVESFQAVVWHLLVTHPLLATQAGHWEQIAKHQVN